MKRVLAALLVLLWGAAPGSQEDLWTEALRIGGGDSRWQSPRVYHYDVAVFDGHGRRVWAKARFDNKTTETGQMVVGERILMYVGLSAPDYRRHLFHEMLHCIWARQAWAKAHFRARNPDSEAWVAARMEEWHAESRRGPRKRR